MKKSKKLCLVLSSIFLVMGLASCGTAGAKGDTGASGTNGTNGQDGKDGTNGKDGTSMLTGTSDPTSSTGNEGDVYLNSTTYDLFKKVNGVWTKIGNIKGSDGKDGKDGQDGEGGTSGVTTYGSTILPNDHGYITVNKGSAKVGESITYTFVANSGYKLSTFKLDDNTYAPASLTNGSFTTTMKADGYVVSANFVTTATKSTVITTAAELTTALETAVSGDTLTLIASDGVNLNNVIINKTGVTVNLTRNGSGTIDLNDFTISADNAVVNLDSSINNTIVDSTPIKVSGSNVVINGNGATLNGTNPITISGGSSSFNNITINTNGSGGGSSYDEGNLFNNIGKFTEPATDKNSERFKKSAITLGDGVEISLKNVTIGAGFDVAINGFGDDVATGFNKVTIEKCTISAGKYKGIYLGNVSTLDIEDSTFDGTNVKASETTSGLINDQQQTGSLIDINQLKASGTSVTIKNNKFNNMNDNGSMSGAILVRTSGDGTFTGALTISGNTFSNNKRDIVLGKGGDNSSLAFTGDKTVQYEQTVNGTTSEIKFYDNTGAFKTFTANKYVFENAQLYGYDSTNPSIKKAITGVKFAGGDGTQAKPFEINTAAQLRLLSEINYNTSDVSTAEIYTLFNTGEYYFKLTDSFSIALGSFEKIVSGKTQYYAETIYTGKNTNFHLDLNGKTITATSDGNDGTNKRSIVVITNEGKLEINDSGTTGNINLTAGLDGSGSTLTSVISALNTITINGGTFVNKSGIGGNGENGDWVGLTFAIDVNSNLHNVKCTINGGTFNGVYCAVRQFCQGTNETGNNIHNHLTNDLVINGGDFYGARRALYMQNTQSNSSDAKDSFTHNDLGTLTIDGGSTKKVKISSKLTSIFIEDGFKLDLSQENHFAPGFEVSIKNCKLFNDANKATTGVNKNACILAEIYDLANNSVKFHLEDSIVFNEGSSNTNLLPIGTYIISTNPQSSGLYDTVSAFNDVLNDESKF